MQVAVPGTMFGPRRIPRSMEHVRAPPNSTGGLSQYPYTVPSDPQARRCTSLAATEFRQRIGD